MVFVFGYHTKPLIKMSDIQKQRPNKLWWTLMKKSCIYTRKKLFMNSKNFQIQNQKLNSHFLWLVKKVWVYKINVQVENNYSMLLVLNFENTYFADNVSTTMNATKILYPFSSFYILENLCHAQNNDAVTIHFCSTRALFKNDIFLP